MGDAVLVEIQDRDRLGVEDALGQRIAGESPAQDRDIKPVRREQRPVSWTDVVSS